jgi:hypothetical protein
MAMLARIDALLTEASPVHAKGRIQKRDAIHTLVQNVPHFTQPMQQIALRRLRQLVDRSLYNQEVCTSGLQLVSVMLRWLSPDQPALAPAVLDEMLNLLGDLGGYRATPHELQKLFELLQAGLVALASEPQEEEVQPPGSPSEVLTRVGPEQLLRLLLRWCERTYQDDDSLHASPMAPQMCFDFNGVGGGLTLPSELAVELVARGAFTLGGWLRYEETSGSDDMLLFSGFAPGGDTGFEIFLQPSLSQIAIRVIGGSTSGASKLMMRRPSRNPSQETCHLMGVELKPGKWHLLLVSMRKKPTMVGRHEAIVFVDGKRLQTAPCAYPGSLAADKASDRATGFATCYFYVGANQSKPHEPLSPGNSSVAYQVAGGGFTGQLGSILLLKGCPSDVEAAALFHAGTQCADPESVCAAASTPSAGGLISGRSATVVAVFAAQTAHDKECTSVCGAVDRSANMVDGVAVLRPLDVRASLGGPLSLLPLIEQTALSMRERRGGDGPGPLSLVLHALTAIIRGDPIYRIELERTDTVGMLGHLLLTCPARTVDADLLAAIMALDTALEGSSELSDQLLQHVLLRVGLWAQGGAVIMLPLLRQLYRLAGQRPEQWQRTDALARMFDELVAVLPWATRGPVSFSTAAVAIAASTAVPSSPSSPAAATLPTPPSPPLSVHSSDPEVADPSERDVAAAASPEVPKTYWVESMDGTGCEYSEPELHAVWDGAFDVLCSVADTSQGLTKAQLACLVHLTLKSGSRGILAGLLRTLLVRTFAKDLRLIEMVLEGGTSSLAFAICAAMQAETQSGSTGLPRRGPSACDTELLALFVKFLGRLLALGMPMASAPAGQPLPASAELPAAARWVQQTSWAKGGWAWLGHLLLGATPDSMLLEALTQLLLGNVQKPRGRGSLARHFSHGIEDDEIVNVIGLQDDRAQVFIVPQVLVPLLHLSSRAPPKLQHCMVLNLSLWLHHSPEAQNHLMLMQQLGWQLPVCTILNGTNDPDRASHALCVRLISEHMVAAIRHPGDEGWAEVLRTVAFLETHTTEPTQLKRSTFVKVLELLRGALPIPKNGTPFSDASLALWANVLRFGLLVEESFAVFDPNNTSEQPTQPGERRVAKAGIVSRLLGGTTPRSAQNASGTRGKLPATATPSTGTTASQQPGQSFEVELEADALVARLLAENPVPPPPPPPAPNPTSDIGDIWNGGVSTTMGAAGAAGLDFFGFGKEQEVQAHLQEVEQWQKKAQDDVAFQASLPQLPPLTKHLRRREDGIWEDEELAVRMLQLIEPLIVQAIVEPLVSHMLHMSAAALSSSGSSSGGGLSIARFISMVGMGGSSGPGGARTDLDANDTLCDVAVRLLLLVLVEADARKSPPLAATAGAASSADGADGCGGANGDGHDHGHGIASGEGSPSLPKYIELGLDPARQLQELLLCAACWCQKPIGPEEGAHAEKKELQQQQLSAALARLMQAWSCCDGKKTTRDVAGGHTELLPAVVPAIKGLLRFGASGSRELAGLMHLPCLQAEPPTSEAGRIETLQRFVDDYTQWRGLLLRKPFVDGLRALEMADAPPNVATDKWTGRQLRLFDQQDATKREQRTLCEKVQRDSLAAFKALSAEVQPRAAITRSVIARTRAAVSQQWAWVRHCLYDDHPIWGRCRTSSSTDLLPLEQLGPPAGASGEITYRLCDWLDAQRRHFVVVPELHQPEYRKDKEKTAGSRKAALGSEGNAASGAAEAVAGGGAATQAVADSHAGEGGERVTGMIGSAGKLLSSVALSIIPKGVPAEDVADEVADEGADEDEDEDEGEEADDEDGSLGALIGSDVFDRPFFQTDAELVRPYGVLQGKLYISDRTVRFLAMGGSGEAAPKDAKDVATLSSVCSAAMARDSALAWPLASVKQMHRRRYLMEQSALELFDDAGDMLLFNFKSKRLRSRVRSWIKKKSMLEYRDRDRGTRGFREQLHELQERWQRRELSNFEYLMRLNELAGRSHNDTNQYPVFPWVLKDYTSDSLNLADPAVFRDLARPMGAQNEVQREIVMNMYEEFDDPDIPKFHYGSHYSTAGFVLYYLLRVEPFTSYHKGLQSGKFDHADRLFHSIERTYHSCTHSSSDVKELVPELFYLPEALLNSNRCALGMRQDGQRVDDVMLPKWASDAHDFIAKHRAALESDHVSANLHHWIDLIFGYKQRGKAAVEALNVFYYLTYGVDFRGLKPDEVRAQKAQINNFGQTPQQLLLTPHPQRRPRALPPPLPGRAREEKVEPVLMYRLDGVPLALLALEEAVVIFDSQRRTHHHRVERGRGLAERPITTGGSEHARLSTFAPNVPVARAVTLVGTDPRARDVLLVSGAHWDHSLCISLAHSSGGTRHRLRYHSDVVTSVAVSKDGKWLMSGSLDSTALLWSLGEGGLASTTPSNAKAPTMGLHPTHVLRGHSAAVLSVALSSAMRLAASGSRDGSTVLYTLRDGKRTRVLREPGAAGIEQLMLCDSGHIVVVAAAGSRMHLFTLNGLLAWSWESCAAGVSALALSSCGGALFCGFDDGAIRSWRLHDLKALVQYVPAPAPITCLFPAEGGLLVGTSQRHLLIYPAFSSVDDALQHAKEAEAAVEAAAAEAAAAKAAAEVAAAKAAAEAAAKAEAAAANAEAAAAKAAAEAAAANAAAAETAEDVLTTIMPFTSLTAEAAAAKATAEAPTAAAGAKTGAAEGALAGEDFGLDTIGPFKSLTVAVDTIGPFKSLTVAAAEWAAYEKAASEKAVIEAADAERVTVEAAVSEAAVAEAAVAEAAVAESRAAKMAAAEAAAVEMAAASDKAAAEKAAAEKAAAEKAAAEKVAAEKAAAEKASAEKASAEKAAAEKAAAEKVAAMVTAAEMAAAQEKAAEMAAAELAAAEKAAEAEKAAAEKVAAEKVAAEQAAAEQASAEQAAAEQAAAEKSAEAAAAVAAAVEAAPAAEAAGAAQTAEEDVGLDTIGPFNSLTAPVATADEAPKSEAEGGQAGDVTDAIGPFKSL